MKYLESLSASRSSSWGINIHAGGSNSNIISSCPPLQWLFSSADDSAARDRAREIAGYEAEQGWRGCVVRSRSVLLSAVQLIQEKVILFAVIVVCISLSYIDFRLHCEIGINTMS